MKYSVRLSDAIHILAYIQIFQGTDLSSEAIAKSVQTNPVTVRKIMGDLRKANLIKTESGKAAPSLVMPPEEISLATIYKAVEKDPAIFHSDKNTAPNCLVGGNIQKVLDQKYIFLQQSVENKMKTIFLSEIIGGILQESTNG